MTDYKKYKPIQIKDKGCHFRSKLEWKYTQFFDYLGIKWKYEPELFDLSKSPLLKGFGRKFHFYLPDFYLPDFDVYLEIKPDRKNQLARLRLEALSLHTGKPCYIGVRFWKEKETPVFNRYFVQYDENGLVRSLEHFQQKVYICTGCSRVRLDPTVCCGKRHISHPSILNALATTKDQIDEKKIWKGKPR